MKKIERLIVRSTVIFTKKPAGSWLTENEPYIVEANGGKTVHFRNPVTGGGTYDQAWTIEQSEFTVIAEPLQRLRTENCFPNREAPL